MMTAPDRGCRKSEDNRDARYYNNRELGASAPDFDVDVGGRLRPSSAYLCIQRPWFGARPLVRCLHQRRNACNKTGSGSSSCRLVMDSARRHREVVRYPFAMTAAAAVLWFRPAIAHARERRFFFRHARVSAGDLVSSCKRPTFYRPACCVGVEPLRTPRSGRLPATRGKPETSHNGGRLTYAQCR